MNHLRLIQPNYPVILHPIFNPSTGINTPHPTVPVIAIEIVTATSDPVIIPLIIIIIIVQFLLRWLTLPMQTIVYGENQLTLEGILMYGEVVPPNDQTRRVFI